MGTVESGISDYENKPAPLRSEACVWMSAGGKCKETTLKKQRRTEDHQGGDEAGWQLNNACGGGCGNH
uniref:Uncharacterized protein n=1 Tax=Knipowitschia caucasica TaxID=637954 RepID=A0AAV2LEV9_KNICA